MAQAPVPAEYSELSAPEDRELNISTILRDVRKNLWWILCISVSCGLLSFIVFHRSAGETYTVEATYVVTTGSSNSAIENLYTVSNMAYTFSRILSSAEMSQIIAGDLGDGYVGGSISAHVVEETNLLQIRVRSGSPRRAFQIIRSIMNNKDIIIGYLSEDVRMNVLVRPVVPAAPDRNEGVGKRALVVFLAALALLLLAAAVRSWLLDTVCSEKDVEKKLGIRCLGVIPHEMKESSPRRRKKAGALLITRPTVSFPYTESVHRMSRKIRNRMHPDGKKVLLVTSVNEHEGKSTVAANIALSLAGAGRKTLLMDLDMRRPSLHRLFDVDEKKIDDIGNLLRGKSAGANLIRRLDKEGLYVIFNTEEYGSSTEMLSGGRLDALLRYLRERFDYIVIDSSPMQLVADAEVIAERADASVLVVREHLMPTDAIREALDALRDSKAAPIGCVLNDSRGVIGGELGGYQYGSDYGYRYGTGYGKYYGRYYGRYGEQKER